MSEINLNSFLKLGYFLNYQNQRNLAININNIDKSSLKGISKKNLISLGETALKKAVSNCFKTGEKHVIPLSGGLDSRAILGCLLQHTESRNIHTYTFGSPGTLDYEIGNQIAKSCETLHTSYPLDKYTYNLEEQIDISRRLDQQTILFHTPPVHEIEQKFSGFNFWIGFMGDPSAGSHLPTSPAKTLEEAKAFFLKKNIFVTSTDLTNCEIDKFRKLIQNPTISKENLTFEEQLDFQNRQQKFIIPHVLIKPHIYKLPFLEPCWLDFSLSLDNKYRAGKELFISILLAAFPKLFSLPVKDTYGLPLRHNALCFWYRRGKALAGKLSRFFFTDYLHPMTNYLNFAEGMRERPDLQKVIKSSVMELQARKLLPWVDIEGIWQRHRERKANHADALLVLASLEIHLKAGYNEQK